MTPSVGVDNSSPKDDFFSDEAYEFLVSGEVDIELGADHARKSAETRRGLAQELIGYKHIANAYFLTQYFIEKDSHERNNGFGGFGGMARAGSYEDTGLRQVGDDPLHWRFAFEHIVAGRGDLLRRMRSVLVSRDGRDEFDVRLGRPANDTLQVLETDNEWFRQQPWKDWPAYARPETPQEMKALAISPDVNAPDHWLDYRRLFEDGKLTIDVHFGYDYYSDYHRKHARATFEWLTGEEMGFTPPTVNGRVATNIDILAEDPTQPLTSTLRVPRQRAFASWCPRGQAECSVIVEVQLIWGMETRQCCRWVNDDDEYQYSYYLPSTYCNSAWVSDTPRTCGATMTPSQSDPNTDDGSRYLEARFRDSLRTADVIHFAGHAGPFYGFSLSNWKREGDTDIGDVSYPELESVEMPSDRYQVLVADGCDTYQTAQAFLRNPNKLDAQGRVKNLDVITTTAYGDATSPYSVTNLILHLVDVDPATERHRPRTVRTLLRDLEDANWGNPLYGIHFGADNPRVHPYADLGWSGASCNDHEDCGAVGNRCVNADSRHGFCAAACTDSASCGEGYECARVAASTAHAIYEYGCVPTGYVHGE